MTVTLIRYGTTIHMQQNEKNKTHTDIRKHVKQQLKEAAIFVNLRQGGCIKVGARKPL